MNKPVIAILGVFVLIFLLGSFLLQEWASVIVILISFGLMFLSLNGKKQGYFLSVFFLAIAIRQVASLVNVYYMLLIGADMDAVGFHSIASSMSRSIQPDWFTEFGNMDVGSSSYIKFLSIFYQIFGDSKLLGQGLSIIAYTVSCLLFLKFIEETRIKQWTTGLISLYGLLPSVIIFTSITMRESYQMLFFLLTAYGTIRLRRKISSLSICYIIVGAIGLILLHNGLVVYALFLTCFNLFWGFGLSEWKKQNHNIFAKIFGILLISGAFAVWGYLASDLGSASKALMSGEGATYAGGYREKSTSSSDRATYGTTLDTSSAGAFFPSAALVFMLYMFAPFPWQLNSSVDIYAALEGILRMLLIYYAVITWHRARGERRSQWGYLLICFFSLEFLWAMGTANWGTAIRHHLVAYSILVIIGGPGLIKSVNKRIFKIRRFGRRKLSRGIPTRIRPVSLTPNPPYSYKK